MSSFDQLHGCLLGGALGDALGLPFERLAPDRARQIFGAAPDGLEMQLLPQRGMLSDDTEHALFTARALLQSGGDAAQFARALRAELRGWIAAFPPGVGKATLMAGAKAWTFSAHTGVFSAGNGPAMRAPILGAFVSDLTQLREFCALSTRLTHTDPKAQWGAFAVALAARQSREGACDGRQFVRDLTRLSDDSPAAAAMIELAKSAVNSAARNQTTREFCLANGWERGVSGYIFHTVPAVLQCWLAHGTDFRGALEAIIRCGGDTDSTAAIVGGIIGARVGADALPLNWRAQLRDWPNSPAAIEATARALAAARDDTAAAPAPAPFVGAALARNAFLLCVVLGHAARRMVSK